MAVSAWRVWRRADASDRARGAALAFWGLQLALNVAWSWLFFGLHRPTLAFVELVALWLAILATIIATARVDRPAAWMLSPYLLWVTYAGSLNGAIARLNP
jgi:tryptophan-rich sensory protein